MRTEITIPEEIIMSKIYLIRGQKVMLDRDLSELYEVDTKVLKQAVRRNIERFPEDFMFEMTKDELELWRSQFVTSKSDMKGLRYAPFCFTNIGIPQLSTVLKSKKAIMINLQIMRVFNKMYEMMLAHKDLFIKLDEIERKISMHDDNIMLIFEYIKQFEESKKQELEQKNRKQIGFKTSEE
ncbi:MAG: ORF6N domain-containing protein [Bacteroidota bacterium]|nr:ORF6N domain-containing protein [Bacteroidota bacterium]